ncbi:GNAT family N-acetyltransferase [Shewanella salipaludis]|uniref:GNAT family N-acetyltransferase n=1 Tax=Shewanella salipaludis TaxID=2723052 RepID=A0A972FT40_9GAMM|nr:GNAT family N-acetyltransferase [Shewanella salipaludis]NMH65680.1 GNAT family N-acetyltransferase [Shewanella salipaludis]
MIRPLSPGDFDRVIALGELVHGAGYMTLAELDKIYHQGIKHGVNASFVATTGDYDEALIGFRLTYAPGQWQLDPWCSPESWGIAPERVCYFKSNTLAPAARGQGLGGRLLAASIAAAMSQGAEAGVTQLWKESPNNAAVRYFTKAGGRLIKEHPSRWNQALDNPDYVCVRCGDDCHCTAVEMLLEFGR